MTNLVQLPNLSLRTAGKIVNFQDSRRGGKCAAVQPQHRSFLRLFNPNDTELRFTLWSDRKQLFKGFLKPKGRQFAIPQALPILTGKLCKFEIIFENAGLPNMVLTIGDSQLLQSFGYIADRPNGQLSRDRKAHERELMALNPHPDPEEWRYAPPAVNS